MSEETADPDQVVTLAHGAGAGAMRDLLEDMVVPRFSGAEGDVSAPAVGLSALDDGAVLPVGNGALVVTTDSHVVSPRFFPGGDIGRLAVAGTVNDLAVMGATNPNALTCSLVLEEGTPLDELDRVIDSMGETAREAGVPISTGDTKVMGRGDVDGLVVNTAGVGYVEADEILTDTGLRVGDAIVVNGSIGDHGIALLSEREGFDFEGDLQSDVAPVNHLVAAAREAGTVTAAKDPTRGGLATALNEMAKKGDIGIEVVDREVPIATATASAGEVLGIDPLEVANEGKFVIGVDSDDAGAVVDAIRELPGGSEAAVIGKVINEHPGRVVLDTGFGRRYLSEPSGEPLPRIC